MQERMQPQSQETAKLTNAEEKALNNLFNTHQNTVTSLLQKAARFYEERDKGETWKSIGTAIVAFFEVLWFAITNPGTIHELIKLGNSLSDKETGQAKLEALLSNQSVKMLLENEDNRKALGSLAVTFGNFTKEQQEALKGGVYAALDMLADENNYNKFIEIAKGALSREPNYMEIAENSLEILCKSEKMKEFFKDHHKEVGKIIHEFGKTKEVQEMLKPYGISEDLLQHSGLFLKDIEKVRDVVKSLNNDSLFIWAEKGVEIINNDETLKKFIQENPQVITNLAKGIADTTPAVKQAMQEAYCHDDVLDILTPALKDTENAKKFLHYFNNQEFVKLAHVSTEILADNQDLRKFFGEKGSLLTPVVQNIVFNLGEERLKDSIQSFQAKELFTPDVEKRVFEQRNALNALPFGIITKTLETLLSDEDFAKIIKKITSALPADGGKLNISEAVEGASDLLRNAALQQFIGSNKADIEKIAKIGLEIASFEKGSPIDKVLGKASVEKILDGMFDKNRESLIKLLGSSKPLLEEALKDKLNMREIAGKAADFLELIEKDPEIKRLITDNKVAVKEILREMKDVEAMKAITSWVSTDNAVEIFTQSMSSLPAILRSASAQLPDDPDKPMGWVDMAKTGFSVAYSVTTDQNMRGILGEAVSKIVAKGIYGNHMTIAPEDLPVFQAAFENNNEKEIEKAEKLLMNAINEKKLNSKYSEVDLENIYFPKGQELSWQFKNCSIYDIHMHNATFIEPNFTNVIFNKSKIISSKLKDGKSDKIAFSSTIFESSTLENMQFKSAGNLANDIRFTNSSLEGLKFEGYNFKKFECDIITKIKDLEFIAGKLSDLRIEDNASVSKITCRGTTLTPQAFKELKAMGEKVIFEKVKLVGDFQGLDLSGMKMQGVDLTGVKLAEGSVLNVTGADLGDLEISEDMLKNAKGMLVAKFHSQGSEKLKEDRADKLIEDFASDIVNEIERKANEKSAIKNGFQEFTKLNNRFNNGEEISLADITLSVNSNAKEGEEIFEDVKESLEQPIIEALKTISPDKKNHLSKALEENIDLGKDKNLLLQFMTDDIERSGYKFNFNGAEKIIDAYAFATKHGLEKNIDSIIKLDSEARDSVIKIGEGIAEQCFGKKVAKDDRANDRKGIIGNMMDIAAEFDMKFISRVKREDNLDKIVGKVVFSGLTNQFDKNQSSGLSALYYVGATNNPWTGKAALKPENLADMKDKVTEEFGKLNLRPGERELAEIARREKSANRHHARAG